MCFFPLSFPCPEEDIGRQIVEVFLSHLPPFKYDRDYDEGNVRPPFVVSREKGMISLRLCHGNHGLALYGVL